MSGRAAGTARFTSRAGEKPHPKTCAACGGAVEVCAEAVSTELRGVTIRVDGVEHGRCRSCGEVYLTLDAANVVQLEAARRLRRARGLLTPDEIRSIRTSLGLSQAGFERLLGTGPKTVVRWEKGTVFQSATADRLMRLLAARPELTALLERDQPDETDASPEIGTTSPDPARPVRRRRT
jgi:HTH-type transcriptional regulator / antitoxin MqsA